MASITSTETSPVRSTSASMSRPSTAGTNTTPSPLRLQPESTDDTLRRLPPAPTGKRHGSTDVIDLVSMLAAADADAHRPSRHIHALQHPEDAPPLGGGLEGGDHSVSSYVEHALGHPRPGRQQRVRGTR